MPPEVGAEASAMRLHRVLLPVLAAALLAASCANPTATIKNIAYGDPAQAYLGMTQSEVISCAGTPHSRDGGAGGSEILTYHYSGAGPVPAPAKDDKDEKKDKPKGIFSGMAGNKDKGNWDCTASFVFEGDKLVRVNFAHKDVDSPYAWQKIKDPEKAEQAREAGVPTCSFTLPNCPR
jgi:hypothetical protein